MSGWLVAQGGAALALLPAAERRTSRLLQNMARLLQERGDYVLAEPLCGAMMQARRETLGDRNEDTLNAINQFASLL